jgi:hypothetical protein
LPDIFPRRISSGSINQSEHVQVPIRWHLLGCRLTHNWSRRTEDKNGKENRQSSSPIPHRSALAVIVDKTLPRTRHAIRASFTPQPKEQAAHGGAVYSNGVSADSCFRSRITPRVVSAANGR